LPTEQDLDANAMRGKASRSVETDETVEINAPNKLAAISHPQKPLVGTQTNEAVFSHLSYRSQENHVYFDHEDHIEYECTPWL